MKDQLQQLGLTATEAEVYLNVLSGGRVSPAMVSRDTGIKRPTVYAAAGELVQRGLLSEDLAGKTKYLVANANDLEKLVIDQKKKLLEQETLAEALLPQLKELARSAKSPVPRITYVRESDLEDFFRKQTPVWNQSMLDIGETSWWGHNSKDINKQKYMQEWITDYWKKAPKKIELRLFSPEHEGETKLKGIGGDRRMIKFWNEEQDASQWIVGDYVVMVVTAAKPQYAIQIKDRTMAESLRRTYRRLWSLSK